MANARKPRKAVTKKVLKSTSITSYTDKDMILDVRSVLRSVVKQDGKYTPREAGVVGKLYGAELTRMKLQVEIHKINTKISSKHTSAKDILRLS